MKRSEVFFYVTVCPIYRVYHCAEQSAQQARGFFGFHSSERCATCQTVFEGWEFWGENGHLQGSTHSTDRARLVHWLKIKAREQWRGTSTHKLWGYRFRLGAPIRYVGGAL